MLSGHWPSKTTDLGVVTDNKNTVNINSLKNLSFDVDNKERVKFSKLIGKEFSIVDNNDYYQELPTGMFIPKKANSTMYNGGTKLKLTGIIRPKNEDSMAPLPVAITTIPMTIAIYGTLMGTKAGLGFGLFWSRRHD